MDDSEAPAEPQFLSSFDKFDEVSSLLERLISVSPAVEPLPEEDKTEITWLDKLTQILNYYQEQPYLLDPHLEELIVPVVNAFRHHVQEYSSGHSRDYSFARVSRLASAIYVFVKVRGYKTIVRFFPHEITDLPIAIRYINSDGPASNPDAWVIRYIMMLWTSLVCMLPFDLAQFDGDYSVTTAESLQTIGITELDKPGLERDGAALLLSRLYMRKDTSTLLTSFLEAFEAELRESPNLFKTIGSLRVIAEITKSGPMEILHPYISRLQTLVNEITREQHLAENTVIRKLRTKCITRTASRLLPARSKKSRSTAKSLEPSLRTEEYSLDDDVDGEHDVPGQVEDAIGELFELLQDKDTSVRWSAAKGIANISERLPTSFVDQIIDNILGHFSVYGIHATPSTLPSTAEHPWHGATLACAELARRNLVPDAQFPNILQWMSKALYFDVQKGSSSVGSNVRDATAYVLWSLARTRSTEALEPYAVELAQNLVTVALFDREIHIRRAASAAFQENVGRMGLFPHGIAVIGVIDFYSVGIRRNAFLVAAPEVYRYKEYRQPILDHLLKITLRHWDAAMRRLGAKSLRKVCETDLENEVPKVLDALLALLRSVDTSDIHGGLLALSELAGAIREVKDVEYAQRYRRKIFHSIDSVASSVVSSPRNYVITEAACYVIANSISSEESDSLRMTSIEPYWRVIILQGLRHRNSTVQEAAAAAMHSLSQLKDCSEDVKRLIKELGRGSAIMQQSLGHVLGCFDYYSYNNGFDSALHCLLEAVNPKSPNFFRDVEARRNAYTSLADVVQRISPKLDIYITPETMNRIWQAFFAGLDDYTVNERGDVGSWVRLACLKGIYSVMESLIREARSIEAHSIPSWAETEEKYSQYLPLSTYHQTIGMILKQGVERLDNVRQCVGDVFFALLHLDHPSFNHGEKWSVQRKDHFRNLLESAERVGWNDGTWLYPSAVRFLDVSMYRQPILRGLLLSIGSKTSSTVSIASSAILSYAHSLPITSTHDTTSALAEPDSYDLYSFVSDLLTVAFENPLLNNMVIPVLHTFNVLLEGGALAPLLEEEKNLAAEKVTKLMELATRNINRLQSMQRIDESMRIVVNLFGTTSKDIGKRAVTYLERFLLHPYPKVRSDTAEALYLVLQTKDVTYDEEVEVILLETEW
ncbi:TBCD protein [Fomitiporia mediterranea MF3/22]|uniref:TBCD protein n=1 Tax=Fomitiporia mediterranea (strain MF3/22) TaxID=694068 RepID=UPI00044080B3|nr:TBCD protein [Fomitiporia mediterranea MF3/22]EJC98100.1 TBCD protein [Fomitiporia mediterranea MF3/22]